MYQQYPYYQPRPPTPYPYPVAPYYPESNRLANDLYEGAAAVGQVQAGFGLVLGAIFSLLIIIFGFTILLTKQPERVPVEGTVLQINGSTSGMCSLQSNKNYVCNILVKVDNIDYPIELSYESTSKLSPNSKITLYALKDDPANVTAVPPSSRWPGVILILFGLVVFGLTSFSYYMTKKHKMYAAAQGFQSAVPFNILPGVSNVFQRRR